MRHKEKCRAKNAGMENTAQNCETGKGFPNAICEFKVKVIDNLIDFNGLLILLSENCGCLPENCKFLPLSPSLL